MAGPSKSDRRKWEVEDAMHTLRRAHEIMADKKLMAEVEKLTSARAQEMHAVGRVANHLAKSGSISAKQLAKLHGKKK